MAALLPVNDTIAYFPHQVEGIRRMIEREAECAEYFRGGILADEPGLGKTYSSIGLMVNNPVANTLLLVPPVLQPQWAKALEECSVPYAVLQPPKRKGAGGYLTEVPGTKPFHVVLSTYDRATNNPALLATMVFDRMICDEGHVFRNGKSTKRFRILAAVPAARRWILSGTPVQNRKQDFNNELLFLGMSTAERIRTGLKEIADVVMIRRTVSLVRELVPTMPRVKPTHVVHPVVMPTGGEEERVFCALVGRFERALERRHIAQAIILELYLRIRQFLAHPAIYVEAMKRKFGAAYERTAWEHSASKMDAFRVFLAEQPKQPTIVFTTFREEMNMATEILEAAGYTVGQIGGGMTDAARTAVIEESKMASAPAIVVQIVAGGAGLNLQHCHRVVFLSSHWNPAIVDQAIARAYRIGQAKHVTVHHILLADDAEKNLDRRMQALHGLKRSEALKINTDLYCETAVSTDDVMAELDAVAPEFVDLTAEEDAVDDDPVAVA
jgi:SNF2 family DNA or RNA helicase